LTTQRAKTRQARSASNPHDFCRAVEAYIRANTPPNAIGPVSFLGFEGSIPQLRVSPPARQKLHREHRCRISTISQRHERDRDTENDPMTIMVSMHGLDLSFLYDEKPKKRRKGPATQKRKSTGKRKSRAKAGRQA
jgi:hypothetical protein